jgi:hypothetical protein
MVLRHSVPDRHGWNCLSTAAAAQANVAAITRLAVIPADSGRLSIARISAALHHAPLP